MKKFTTKRYLEEYGPIVFSLIITFLCVCFKITRFHINNFTNILNSLISMISIILGFLATMISILIAAVSRRTMKRIEQHNATSILTSYINVTIVSGLLSSVISVAYNTFLEQHENIYWYMFLVWVFIVSLFLSSTYRILYLLLNLLNKLATEDKDENHNIYKQSDPKKLHFDSHD